MKNKNSILQIIGVGLIVCSLMLLVGSRIHEARAQESAAFVVARIEELLPEKIEGSIEEYSNMNMPTLQIDGKNFCGVLDIPAFGVTLPVYDTWESNKISLFPGRFYGSVYDGSLVIGGADQEGQFAFCDQIDVGAFVSVTDMTGAEFEYVVTRIDRSKEADAETLIRDDIGLVLFTRDQYSMEYLIVRCDAGI